MFKKLLENYWDNKSPEEKLNMKQDKKKRREGYFIVKM